MKSSEIKPGGTYGIRIKGKVTPVRIEAGHYHKDKFLGWTAVVAKTGEEIAIEPGQRFTRLKGQRSAQPEALLAVEERVRLRLGLDTLETRNRDSLDFHEHSVASIREVVAMAYEAGLQAGVMGHKK